MKEKDRISEVEDQDRLAAELVGLISEMLQQHGHNIEGKDGPICCLASNEFVVAMYLVEPSHAFYEILQHDDGENMLKVFTAVWRMDSNTIDLRLCRDGPWQKSFRSFVDETIDPGRARNLNRRTDLPRDLIEPELFGHERGAFKPKRH
jgi:hypothetical protein